MKVWSNWKEYPAGEWRWPSFSPQEIACRGTGKLVVNERALDMLQALRAQIGKPFIIRSAYRSPEHNTRVGGAKASKHMEGIAFDIDMGNHFPDEFMAAAETAGFMGIGTYPKSGFLHIDARPTPARWGQPFPPRQGRFAPEAPPVEEVRPKEKDRDKLKGAATVIGGAMLTDIATTGGQTTLDTVERVSGLPVIAQVIIGVVVVALVGLYVWRQVRGARG